MSKNFFSLQFAIEAMKSASGLSGTGRKWFHIFKEAVREASANRLIPACEERAMGELPNLHTPSASQVCLPSDKPSSMLLKQQALGRSMALRIKQEIVN